MNTLFKEICAELENNSIKRGSIGEQFIVKYLKLSTFMTHLDFFSNVGGLVVIKQSKWYHPSIHHPSNILLRSPSAHSNSVLTFPNCIEAYMLLFKQSTSV